MESAQRDEATQRRPGDAARVAPACDALRKIAAPSDGDEGGDGSCRGEPPSALKPISGLRALCTSGNARPKAPFFRTGKGTQAADVEIF